MNGQQDNEREASMSEERNIKTPTNGTNGNGNGEGVVGSSLSLFLSVFGLRISDLITLLVVYNCFSAESGQATTHRPDVILHAT